MSSINAAQKGALTRFYRRHIIPLARLREMDWLERGIGDADDTYFLSRPCQVMAPDDFCIPLGDEQQAIRALEQAWAGTPLEGLGRELVKLARHFQHTEQEATVASYIYEMF